LKTITKTAVALALCLVLGAPFRATAVADPLGITWQNPVTDGIVMLSAEWTSNIEPTEKRPGIAFAFTHKSAQVEVILSVQRTDDSTLTEYTKRLRAESEIDWGVNLWQLTRKERDTEVFYAAHVSPGLEGDVPPIYLVFRVWRDSNGHFWSSSIICPLNHERYLDRARELARALESTVIDPRSAVADPLVGAEPI